MPATDLHDTHCRGFYFLSIKSIDNRVLYAREGLPFVAATPFSTVSSCDTNVGPVARLRPILISRILFRIQLWPIYGGARRKADIVAVKLVSHV
jgi:hypothetical protein